MNPPNQPPLKITEVDDEGWAAFKREEAEHRQEYASSELAKKDHEAWLHTKPAGDDEWGSIPAEEAENLHWPKIIPNPMQIPLDELVDMAST